MSKKRKLNIDYFKNYAIERNGECLSNEYINCNYKLKFKCNKGHIWETKAYYISNSKTWCPHCNGHIKDNIETFKKIAIERGGECLSDSYISSKSKLEFKCCKGHIWKAIPECIKNNKTWCPICINKNILLTIEEMKKLAIERDGECLSDTYINNNTDLKWKCKNSHIWYAPPNRIKSAKTWCLECSGSKRKTIEYMREIAKEKNGKCLSEKYVGAHSNLIWECKKGHQWSSSYHQIKTSNSWCPTCKDSKGEKIIKIFLDENNIKYIKQKRFKDCRNKYPLPFDYYLPNENILIEYDGILHYKPIEYFGGEKEFELRKYLDSIKDEYCINNNIKLIRIPYFEKNIQKKLKNELEL